MTTIRQKKLPDVMDSLLRSVTNVLTGQGFSPAEALNMAESAALNFLQEFTGEEIYIPGPDKLKQLARDREIVRNYNSGSSVRQLVADFNLSESHIFRILSSSTE